VDSILTMLGKSPFRCRRCERRFYAVQIAKPVVVEGEVTNSHAG